jgi:hypothetical protein
MTSARSASAIAELAARGSFSVDNRLSRMLAMAWAISSVVATCSREARAISPIFFRHARRALDIAQQTVHGFHIAGRLADLDRQRGHAAGGLLRLLVDLAHHGADFVGGFLGAQRQLAHLAGDHGKAAPCSPARAASMAAFSASRLVRAEISLMASVKP